MSFLFAELPAKNGQMTETELLIWQRSAIFECECDNLINQHIESDDRPNRLRTSRWQRIRRLDSIASTRHAIDAAISAHGLRLGSSEHARTRNPTLVQNQLTRSSTVSAERDNDLNVLAGVLDNAAYSAAARNLGLNLPNHDP